MSYLTTATVLATFSDTIPASRIASFVGERMEQLLDSPPPNRDNPFAQLFHEPLVGWSTTTCLTSQPVIRVEVCVDLDRLGDLAYKDALVRDAKRVTVEFLEAEAA